MALLYVGLMRTRRICHSEIKECVVEVVDSKILYDVWAPILRLKDGSETVLTALARAGFQQKVPARLHAAQQVITQAGEFRREW
ncbi:MAG: hypothetical protein ACLGIA_04320 [Actinomycetes bacterium]